LPKIPGVSADQAVRALKKAGFVTLRQGRHIVMSNGHVRLRFLDTTRSTPTQWAQSQGTPGSAPKSSRISFAEGLSVPNTLASYSGALERGRSSLSTPSGVGTSRASRGHRRTVFAVAAALLRQKRASRVAPLERGPQLLAAVPVQDRARSAAADHLPRAPRVLLISTIPDNSRRRTLPDVRLGRRPRG